jgi:hypothetical protein
MIMRLVASAAGGIIAAGSVAYSYVQREEAKVAVLERANAELSATVTRESTAIDRAIAVLQAAKKKEATGGH